MNAMWSLWKAELLRTVRDRRFFTLTLGMPIIFYFVFMNQVGTHARISGTFWNAYFMVSMAAFGVVGSSVNTLAVRLATERKSGWVRFLRTTPLSSAGYTLAKILTQLSLSFFIIFVVFFVAQFSAHVTMPPMRWFEIFLWLWIGSIPFAALGVFIGMAGNAAQVLGTLVYLVLSMLGGLWTPIQALPRALQEVAQWMPTYRFAQPAWELLAERPISWVSVAILLGYAGIFSGLAAWIERKGDAHQQE
ncbi:ABC transporter permease [Sulfoacidibacillus thermotolerans]|uniref:ABC transporter n=1 Tax=Sulfoacidibacillus thermotolerans TaxID=1765684 RepID=A0A2U3D9T0_SULT2|nr:ABC transporter permease [Sulfoacidibacillus thermotolerans]PWI58025.1 ABC transporter [Sulfoacidibacillus thermotolerans]